MDLPEPEEATIDDAGADVAGADLVYWSLQQIGSMSGRQLQPLFVGAGEHDGVVEELRAAKRYCSRPVMYICTSCCSVRSASQQARARNLSVYSSTEPVRRRSMITPKRLSIIGECEATPLWGARRELQPREPQLSGTEQMCQRVPHAAALRRVLAAEERLTAVELRLRVLAVERRKLQTGARVEAGVIVAIFLLAVVVAQRRLICAQHRLLRVRQLLNLSFGMLQDWSLSPSSATCALSLRCVVSTRIKAKLSARTCSAFSKAKDWRLTTFSGSATSLEAMGASGDGQVVELGD
jgi:hypothetical protein